MSVITDPVVTETVTVADVLEHAADILEEFDWRQATAGSRFIGAMCALGAIRESVYDYRGYWDTDSDLYGAACGINGFPAEGYIWPLARWNDWPGRTKAEVVARLREAAKERQP